MELYDSTELANEVVALAALVALQTMFNYQNYIYDIPTLAIFTFGLQLLAQERILFFVAVYSVGLFCKETVVLLALVFFLHNWRRMQARKFVFTMLFLVTVFVGSRVLLNAVYSNNLGDYLLPQLFKHNVALLHSYPPASVVATGGILALTFGYWPEKPVLARNALCVLWPLLASCAVFGFLDELRDYYEAYPAVVLLVAFSVARLTGIKIASRQNTRDMTPMLQWLGGLAGAR
jgi:hypothetical protein